MNRLIDSSTALVLASVLFAAQAQTLPPEIPDAPAPGTADAPATQEHLRVVGRVELDQLADDQRYSDHLDTQRLVGDLRVEGRPAPSVTFRLSDRLEWLANPPAGQAQTLNILREFHLSDTLPWSPQGGLCGVDAGRVNWKLGNSLWYSPLDYFKRNASVSTAAMTPASIRENRLGTVMLRGQCDSGPNVVQAAFVPRLRKDRTPDTSGYSLGLDRTNPDDAFIVRGSRTLAEGSTAEASVLYRDGEGSTVGVGLSQLFGDAVVMGLDLANAPALSGADGRPFGRRATRAALSLAWTIPAGPTLTLEMFHQQDAYGAAAWNTVRGSGGTAPPPAFISYVVARSGLQELPTRTSYFAMLNWLRAFDNPNYELLSAVSWNPYDGSHYMEASATWHIGASSSLQFLLERNQGAAHTQYGITPIKTAATLAWMLHF